MLAILITNITQDPAILNAKVNKFFDLVSFMVYEGQIQRTEVRYQFHLVELLLESISRGGLSEVQG